MSGVVNVAFYIGGGECRGGECRTIGHGHWLVVLRNFSVDLGGLV